MSYPLLSTNIVSVRMEEALGGMSSLELSVTDWVARGDGSAGHGSDAGSPLKLGAGLRVFMGPAAILAGEIFDGQVTALDHVSLSIQPGDVVGLLGPNGAGKTTMLKMLTGYLPPTEGTARVANLDILENSLEVRRRIGYLPETNPLYEDLAVYESLEWTARLRGMEPSVYRAGIRHVVEVCGLAGVVGKDIAHLSKGYRQRVGMAQVLLHEPDVLILDEPTAGLDPNQIRDVRNTIRTLGRSKTILLSTHILQEVEAIASRVLFINEGRLVFDGPVSDLKADGRDLDAHFHELTT